MSSSDFSGRLLPQVVDDLAIRDPDSLYCVHPSSSLTLNDGWRKITFSGLATAVDRVAWWLDRRLGGKKEQQILAYIGSNDLRYAAFMLACMKLGHAALLLSTRNSQSAFQHLLSKTGCSVLVDAIERKQLQQVMDDIEASMEDHEFQRWKMPALWEVFSPTPVEPYRFSQNYSDIQDRSAVVIHSSGTTGHPKPIVLSYGYLATVDQMQFLPVPPGRQTAQLFVHYRGKLRFFHGPFFHFIGLVCLMECVFYHTPFLLAPDRPLTPESMSQIMAGDNPPVWGLLSPYIIKEVSATETGRKALAGFSSLNFGGSPMSTPVGDTVNPLCRLRVLFGSSETGYTPTLTCEDPHDWEYIEWNPSFKLRMEDVGNGLSELVLPRPSDRRYHGVFHTYPHLSEYRTGDLFRPHPSKDGLWRYAGRGDDIIVLSNGEKFNPIDAEKVIESHSLVEGAVILGEDRFQAALLVEPRWDELPTDQSVDWLRNQIWDVIQKANALLPAHAQVLTSHVAFVKRDQPFARSPKGTLRRREIASTYKSLLDDLYSSQEASKLRPISPPTTPASTKASSGPDLDATQDWLQHLVIKIMGHSGTFSVDDDLVHLGMDSLQALRLSQAMQEASKTGNWSSAAIYDLSTVRRLADAFDRCQQEYNNEQSPNEYHEPRRAVSRTENLTRFIRESAGDLGNLGLTVALTGSTGELGTFLLHTLLRNPNVAMVHCLNRSADAQERQVSQFESKGLTATLPWLLDPERVQFHQVSLHDENLGLSVRHYEKLRDQVDVIIHNAWTVNFTQPLAMFAPQVTGVRRLLQLVDGSPRRAQLHFISSISTISAWSRHNGPLSIPEALHDDTAVLNQGYAESKFVAERLCGLAAEYRHVPIAIHRVGQLGGPSIPTAGMWNPRDWVPSLIKTSRTTGELPESLGPMQVDWVPIDTAAQSIVEIVQSQRSKDLAVYHIVNPHPVQWMQLAPLVSQACSAKLVSLESWVESLRQKAALEDKVVDDVPAVLLLEFFTALVRDQDRVQPPAAVDNAKAHSVTMCNLEPIDNRMMKIWLQQWKGWI